MASTDLETLVVSLEARIDKYQKAMDKALGVAQDRAGKINGVFGSMSKQIDGTLSGFGKNAFAGLMAGAIAPIAAVLGVGEAFAKAKEAMQAFSTISDDAKASGLDPDISPANARLQAPRVADERGISVAKVNQLVDDHTTSRAFGILGEKAVNVLELNLALDRGQGT